MHTTARLEFDRDTYTPCTSEELPSFAEKTATIAERSDLVAARPAELLASALAVGAIKIASPTAPATAQGERQRTFTDRAGVAWR